MNPKTLLSTSKIFFTRFGPQVSISRVRNSQRRDFIITVNGRIKILGEIKRDRDFFNSLCDDLLQDQKITSQCSHVWIYESYHNPLYTPLILNVTLELTAMRGWTVLISQSLTVTCKMLAFFCENFNPCLKKKPILPFYPSFQNNLRLRGQLINILF